MSDWIEETSARAIDPARVRRALARIGAAWPPEQPPLEQIVRTFPDDAAPLLHLLSMSTIAPEKLIHDPSALSWLAQADVARRNRTQREMESAFETFRANSQHGAGRTPPTSSALDERFVPLRQWKQREMLRIALREVAGWCTVEQSTLELTQLAEIAVRTVVDEWMHELTRRWGRPKSDFAVLAMGKFGGAELNYSSDIDLVFFYGEDGHLNPRFTHQEFFGRLAERVIATFSAHDQAGALFRIDVRLRPEGVSGPLVRPLESMEHYYSGFGETWERMALIKARLVAGSEELGYEFSHRLQPFIFPRSISPDVVEEISAIKQRIEDEIVGQSSLRRNVKLGYGGIREIEFIVQTLQILHGARHAFLQERNTLKTLRALRQLDIIPHQQMEALIDAYRFLRTVEHRLQITSEAQTHTLPDDSESLQRLAISLGVQRIPALQAELAKHTGAVRAIFEQVLRTPKKTAPEPEFDFTVFQRRDEARRIFAELDGSAATARFSPRTKKLARKLEPLLLEWLGRVADPDATLTRFVRFVERYGARGLLFETLIRNPRVLELLVRLFDASRFLSEIVFRRPQLVEEVARAGGLGESRAVNDYQQGLARNEENLPWREWVRVYRRAQLLRIGLRDVLAFSTLEELQREYSALAEACLLYVQHQLGLDHALSIIAMGKFGARELTYGADLDVIFIGTEPKGAAEIIRAMTESTAEGTVFPVDARLRPEGEGGPLVTTMDGYEAYFRGRAQLWEAQSLIKARPISGPYRETFLPLAQKVWADFGKRPGLFAEIAGMHARVQKERTSGGDFASFKTGRGGLMHLEFFVQAHQLAAQLPEQNTIAALARLAEKGRISQSDAAKLSKSYLWLRRVEATLRRFDDKPVSTLPTDPLEQRRLAIRCAYPSTEPFLAEYREARGTIADICRWPADSSGSS